MQEVGVRSMVRELRSCVPHGYVEPAVLGDDAQGCQCPFVLCLHPQGCLRRGSSERHDAQPQLTSDIKMFSHGAPAVRWQQLAFFFIKLIDSLAFYHLPV